MSRQQAYANLSPRAKALLARIRKGRWYGWESKRTPKAMLELIAAGFVHDQMRVARVVRCWVAKGHTNYRMDRAPDEPR